MNLPGFHALSSAWLFLLLIPLLILYFLKLKRPRQEIPSLALWRQVINDQRVNSPFQKFRRNILLLLQLLLLLALILAAMQPFLRGGPQSYRNLPILIDCSASMGALDKPDGRTRLDVAKEEVSRLIDNLGGDQRIALIAVTNTGRRVTDFTNNKRILREALDDLTVADVPGRLEDALRMTLAMSRTEPIESVLVFSDGNIPPQVDFELPFDLTFQQLPVGGANVGIIEFNARRTKVGEWDVFARVGGTSAEESGGDLMLLRDGELIAEETVIVREGQSQRLSFRVNSESSVDLELRLKPDSFDSLQCDNVAWLALPEARPLNVFAAPGLASWRHALNGIDDIEIWPPADGSEAGRYDVVISDEQADEERDAAVRVFLGLIPAELQNLIEHGNDQAEVADADPAAPLLQHVRLTDIRILNAPVRREGAEENEIERLGYEILAWSSGGPLLLKKRDGVKLTYYFLFHTDNSTLPFRLAFPIIVSNTIQRALTLASMSEVRGQRTGVLETRQVEADREYRVVAPDGSRRAIESTPNGLLRGIPARSVGQYRIQEGGDLVATIGAGLLDAGESSLAAVSEIRFKEITVAAAGSLIRNDRPLWRMLAVVAFVLLLLEWWFFQRRPVA